MRHVNISCFKALMCVYIYIYIETGILKNYNNQKDKFNEKRN